MNFTGLSSYHLYHFCAQIIKFTLKFSCNWSKISSDMDKFGELMCQFCVCYLNIYNLYKCKHETVRSRLIGYLTFISVNWNLKTTDQLTGYSVKVHSTSSYIHTRCSYIAIHSQIRLVAGCAVTFSQDAWGLSKTMHEWSMITWEIENFWQHKAQKYVIITRLSYR